MKNEEKKPKIGSGSHLVFQNGPKNIPRENIHKINISCKFISSSYNIEGARALTVKSLRTLWRRQMHSIHRIPSVDTIIRKCNEYGPWTTYKSRDGVFYQILVHTRDTLASSTKSEITLII